MNQSSVLNTKQAFERVRKQYPEKLVDLADKQAILSAWIAHTHLDRFQQIYHVETQSQHTSNQKVIDSSDKSNQTLNLDQKAFQTHLSEAIKIIVQAYQKNQLIKQNYHYQQVEEIVQKTQLTLKQLLKIQPNQPKSNQNLQSNPSKSSQTNHVPQKVPQKIPEKVSEKKPEPVKQTKQQNSGPIQKSPQQSVHRHSQPVAPKPVIQQPKSNSLFVQKQKPISEQNIFKGQNFRRPSSRLQNDKPEHMMGQKPKSSAKSNRSKRSKLSSRGIDVQKKSQKLSESKLDILQVQKPEEGQPIFDADGNKSEAKPQEENENHDEGQDEVISQENEDEPQPEQKKKQIVFDQDNNLFHLPTFRLSNERSPTRKNPIESILSNPFIKKAFTHLCKQSYIGGGKTFDQIAQSADIMTLNKWMVFCKEFDFVSKLKKKLLVDIFKQCTDNKPHMNQKQFLDALIIVQNKMKVDEEDFIRKQICLDSEFAFRQKVAAFKINFAGPKVNFFEQATIKPLDKYYQNLRQQKYQTEKEKQREYILHQGKFKEDIEGQIIERRNQRYLKKSNILNSPLTDRNDVKDSQIYKRKQAYAINSPYLKYVENKSHLQNNYSSVQTTNDLKESKIQMSRRIQPLKYSQIFSQKNSLSTRSFTNDKSIAEIKENQISKNLTELKKTKHMKTMSESQKTVKKNTKNENLTESTKDQHSTKSPATKPQIKPQRQWALEIKNWAQEFDKSQSEESDDILREHMINEKMKKKNLTEKMNLSRIAEEFRKDEKWLEKEEFEEHSEWEKETQLQVTSKKQSFK